MKHYTNEQYRAEPGISSTDIKSVALRSLHHWRYGKRKEKAAFDLGTAVHALVLEPHLDLVVRGPDDRRGNDWKEKKLEADFDGKLLLTSGDYDNAFDIAEAVNNHPWVRYCGISRATIEGSYFATDEKTGVDIKCRPDAYWPEDGLIMDLKTCRDASPAGFARDVARFGYDLQAAHYLRTLDQAGQPAREFLFVCVEKEAPYAVCVHRLSPDYIKSAQAIVTATLLEIKEALATLNFPTKWPEINTIQIPSWRVDDEDDDENFDF